MKKVKYKAGIVLIYIFYGYYFKKKAVTSGKFIVNILA